MEATKEQFHTYLAIQYSGVTNMFHDVRIIDIARDKHSVMLDRRTISYIQNNYAELKEEYGDIEQ